MFRGSRPRQADRGCCRRHALDALRMVTSAVLATTRCTGTCRLRGHDNSGGIISTIFHDESPHVSCPGVLMVTDLSSNRIRRSL